MPTGGYFITKDTTTAEADDFVKETKTSVRNYRSSSNYEAAISAGGFDLVDKVEMTTSGPFTNHICLWRRS